MLLSIFGKQEAKTRHERASKHSRFISARRLMHDGMYFTHRVAGADRYLSRDVNTADGRGRRSLPATIYVSVLSVIYCD